MPENKDNEKAKPAEGKKAKAAVAELKQCGRCATVLPLCCLFSLVTAVIIAILLAFTFANIRQQYDLISATDYKGSLAKYLSIL